MKQKLFIKSHIHTTTGTRVVQDHIYKDSEYFYYPGSYSCW